MNRAQVAQDLRHVDAPAFLLIEDNDDDIVLTKRSLAKARIGNRILSAANGEEALDMLYEDALDGRFGIGVVLLDLNLPKLDGRELLKRIWEDRRLRNTPVVVLTGSSEEDDQVKSYKSGAVAFLRKPIQVDHFLSLIGDLTDYSIFVTHCSN